MRSKVKQKKWMRKLSFLTILALIMPLCMTEAWIVQAIERGERAEETIIHAEDYGADPNGILDSTQAIQQAFAAAKEAKEAGASKVVVDFPKGEYHIYKDYAEKREYHTSNTNSIESPEKTIGLLIEDQHDFTLRGNDSLFMMHGNMMALAVVDSSNVILEDFSWDFAVPTVSEMTITDMGEEDGKPYTDFYIPKCFPYEIQGTTIQWHSEPSPYTGEYYWTEQGIHNAYSIVAYHPDEEMTRAYFTSDTPFGGVSNIRALDGTDGTVVRITYTRTRPAMQKKGMVLELASSAYRETAGAFTWESEQVTARNVNVHFMHGFGWLVQMSKDVYYYDCNLMPRDNSGHVTVSYADGIHASGAAGDLVIENCNFSNTHDDPINLHGTFTRVERRQDAHTLQLKYIHTQQGGFPQYHVGDKVAFFTRDTLESTDQETLYTVEEVISNPGESGNDLRTMVIRFAEELPEHLSDQIGGQPKYVAENVTYAPKVTIKGCTFKNVPTRGILCTTRNPVVIEDNTFLNMSMATIFLSNDSNEWYESGPIRDMVIRNNNFYVKTIGRTSWEYAPAVYVHPVTKGGGLPSADNPIHKNITIEGNTFHMDVDTVVKAESVENLTIRNNTIVRTNPDISLEISASKTQLSAGETGSLQTEADGSVNRGTTDNVYEFTKCKNVILEGNTYDDGLKRYAVLQGMPEENLTNHDADIQAVSTRDLPPSEPVKNICYASTNPEVVFVDPSGQYTALKEGTADILAYYKWNGTIVRSNQITVTVGDGQAASGEVKINGEDNICLQEIGATHTFTATGAAGIAWSVEDFLTGEETDAAQIDENGRLTANRNGVVWVKASAGGKSDKKAVILAISTLEGKNPLLSVTRENIQNYKMENNEVTINLEKGDLYQDSNNVKNLFLFDIPEQVDKNNVRAVLTMDRLPIKENGQWDTASFIFYKDDDNYVTVGKKSHMNGISIVKEINGRAVETPESNGDNDQVTKAVFGFYKSSSGISIDYKIDGSDEWKHLADITDVDFGDNFKIGFAGWVTNLRGKDLVCSDLRIGSGDMSYEELCEQEVVAFKQIFDNQLPVASNVTLNKTSYHVGEEVSVTFDFQDADGDLQGTSLYRFTCVDENGNVWEEVSDSPSAVLKHTGTLVCSVYPVDAKGYVGNPVQSAEVQVQQQEGGNAITELTFNGTILYQLGQTEKEFDVYLPAELTKAVIGYQSRVDEVTINGNAAPNPAVVDLQEEIRIECGEERYIIHVHAVEDNYAELTGISIEDLSFTQTSLSDGSWFLNADSSVSEAELKITANERIGSVELLNGYGRKEAVLTRNGTVWTAPLSFVNGMNSYYIRAVAKDGITANQYQVHINYAASTDAKLEDIKINNVSVEGFNHDGERMLAKLTSGNVSAQIDVDMGNAAEVYIMSGNKIVKGAHTEIRDLVPGSNEIRIIAKASDGTRQEYSIVLLVEDASNADLFDLTINGKSVLSDLNDGAISWMPAGGALNIKATAQDSRAIVKLQSNTDRLTGQGSVEKDVDVFEQSLEIQVQVTSFNGTKSNTYRIICEKDIYLSDLEYRQGATVGYGSIMKDKSSSGKAIRLTGEDGGEVVYQKGIGTHADSVITYDLPHAASLTLQGAVGADYEKHNSEHAALQFSILTEDETELFQSGIMNGATPQKTFSLDVTDVGAVVLKVVQASNNWDAHADWADMKLSVSYQNKPEDSADVTALTELLDRVDGMDFSDCTPEQIQDVLRTIHEAEALWEKVKKGEAVSQSQIDDVREQLKAELDKINPDIPTVVDLKDCTITLNPESCVYNGKPQCPEVTVTYQGQAVPLAEYKIEYANNTEPGTATVIITAIGSGYKGTVTKEFQIKENVEEPEKIDLNDCTVTLHPTTYIYNGKPQQPAVTVTYQGEKVSETEYQVTYLDNINAGNNAKVVVTGADVNYKGSKTVEFTIQQKALKTSMVTMKNQFKWKNGKQIRPEVSVKDGTTVLKAGTDYTVVYPKKSADIGSYIVTITGKGNYTSVAKMPFKVYVKKGSTYTLGGMKYKITGASTVAMTGAAKKNISSVIVKSKVKIGGKAFQVTKVGNYAFKNYKNLKKVVMGTNIKAIGKGAFRNCAKLNRIQIKSKKLKSVGRKAIAGIHKKAVIKVPKNKMRTYKKLLKSSTGYKKSMKLKALH